MEPISEDEIGKELYKLMVEIRDKKQNEVDTVCETLKADAEKIEKIQASQFYTIILKN
jgi:hypothetical protein